MAASRVGSAAAKLGAPLLAARLTASHPQAVPGAAELRHPLRRGQERHPAERGPQQHPGRGGPHRAGPEAGSGPAGGPGLVPMGAPPCADTAAPQHPGKGKCRGRLPALLWEEGRACHGHPLPGRWHFYPKDKILAFITGCYHEHRKRDFQGLSWPPRTCLQRGQCRLTPDPPQGLSRGGGWLLQSGPLPVGHPALPALPILLVTCRSLGRRPLGASPPAPGSLPPLPSDHPLRVSAPPSAAGAL